MKKKLLQTFLEKSFTEKMHEKKLLSKFLKKSAANIFQKYLLKEFLEKKISKSDF